jgi:hypothetical protein
VRSASYGSDLSKIDLTRSNLVELSHVSEQTRRAALQVAQAHPQPLVTLSDVADHIEHIRQVAGVDHVGLGSDFDGIPEATQGLDGGRISAAARGAGAPRLEGRGTRQGGGCEPVARTARDRSG